METESRETGNPLPPNGLLILDSQDQHVSVNYEQPSITMGRDSENRIVISHPKVSRLHARVEMRKDQFILTDQSTNGTHIHPTVGDAMVLKNDEQPLTGDGTLYLGKASTPDAPEAIHYHTL